MNELAINVKNLTKKFENKTAVDHISLEVKRGSIFGFLGANGSGKTTTIRMLCGLLTPTAGEGTCLGYDIKSQSEEIKLKIGYMPQKFSYYTGLTVYQNLHFIADIYQLKNPVQAINDIIADLSLESYRNQRAANLSGGWKQRLALSCCLLTKPELVFLDEPTAGIDPKARKEFWDYLHKISVQAGTTILVTTHYMDEAEKCTNLAYINKGILLYTGKTKNIIPYSKVKTYVLETNIKEQTQLIERIKHSFPKLLASVVNNELRISSRNHEELQRFLQQYSDLIFKEVEPSFEEVFIGLIE